MQWTRGKLCSLYFVFVCFFTDSLTVPCSGPVTYNTSEFAINVPCPNDVLIALFGDNVQYRCEYEEKQLELTYLTGILLDYQAHLLNQKIRMIISLKFKLNLITSSQ